MTVETLLGNFILVSFFVFLCGQQQAFYGQRDRESGNCFILMETMVQSLVVRGFSACVSNNWYNEAFLHSKYKVRDNL
jgi:hypothetical protein